MLKAIGKKIKEIPSWIYWTGLTLVGLFIIIFNDVWGKMDGFIEFSLIYFIFLIIFVVRAIFKQLRSVIELKKDKAKMEMLHLKSQVNPHFFFNTLNNLYGLVEKDPKSAQSMILKLSDLMRYSIYEGQNEWVTLEEEINYLKNYISLHENRYHKKININFDIDSDDQSYAIMPLMLILLLENAFKHGVEKIRNDAYINIQLKANNGNIDFTIVNNYDPDEVSPTSGIGINNLKRRLEIGYPKKHELKITKLEDTFKAHLALQKL